MLVKELETICVPTSTSVRHSLRLHVVNAEQGSGGQTDTKLCIRRGQVLSHKEVLEMNVDGLIHSTVIHKYTSLPMDLATQT